MGVSKTWRGTSGVQLVLNVGAFPVTVFLSHSPGSDIIMQLDDVVSSTMTGPRVEEAMYRYVCVCVRACVRACVCVCVGRGRGRESWSCSLVSLPLTKSLWLTTRVLFQINPLAGPVHCSPSAAGQTEPLRHHPGWAGCGSPGHLPQR